MQAGSSAPRGPRTAAGALRRDPEAYPHAKISPQVARTRPSSRIATRRQGGPATWRAARGPWRRHAPSCAELSGARSNPPNRMSPSPTVWASAREASSRPGRDSFPDLARRPLRAATGAVASLLPGPQPPTVTKTGGLAGRRLSLARTPGLNRRGVPLGDGRPRDAQGDPLEPRGRTVPTRTRAPRPVPPRRPPARAARRLPVRNRRARP